MAKDDLRQQGAGGGGQKSPILRRHSLWTAPKDENNGDFQHRQQAPRCISLQFIIYLRLCHLENIRGYHLSMKTCILLITKIVLTYYEKKMFQWSIKTFEIQSWRPRICKIFEITRTIYSNSERSEQFLLTEYFFNLFLEVSQI